MPVMLNVTRKAAKYYIQINPRVFRKAFDAFQVQNTFICCDLTVVTEWLSTPDFPHYPFAPL